MLRTDAPAPTSGVPAPRVPTGSPDSADLATDLVTDLDLDLGRTVAAPTAPARDEALDELADVLLGAVALTAALARVAATVTARTPRAVLDRVPVPAYGRAALRRARQALGEYGHVQQRTVTGRLRALTDVVVPDAVRAVLSRLDVPALLQEYVDLDAIVAQVDLDAAAARLDVDRVADRLDLERVVDRLDLDGIVDRVDLDRAAARLDLDRVADRLDLDRVADRLDLDRVADRLDLDRVADRLDLDGIVDRVDLDRAAARLDLDRIVDRLDVVGVARYVVEALDLAGLIRSSTGSVTSEVVRGVRVQAADADRVVERMVDRILLRRHGRRTATGDTAPSDGAGATPVEDPNGDR